MASRFLKNLISSRLFRPVFIVLIVAGLAQVVISQWLISDQVERLIGTAGSALEASSDQLSDSSPAKRTAGARGGKCTKCGYG